MAYLLTTSDLTASPSHRQGMTLVEVMIAIVIILLVWLGGVQVLEFNTRASVSALKRIQASAYLDQITNHLRRSNIAELKDHYQKFPQIIANSDFSADATIQKPAEDASRLATITVRWTLNNLEHSLSADVTLAPQ